MTGQNIPKTWTMVALDDLGEWRGGGTPSKSNESFWDGHIPWVSPKDMKVSRIRDTLDHITELAIEKSATKLVPENSILMVTRSGILAHTFPVAKTDVQVTLNQDLKALTTEDGIDPDYIAWAFRALQREILGTCSKSGTTVHSIEMPFFMAFQVPVAPTNEQHHIVAKIEELFSELDKGIESLKTAREQLKVYRQTVLKHAFEGKLTAHWREQNKDKPETAAQRLARSKKEREARYQKQLKEWKTAVKTWEVEGKPGKKPSKPKAPSAPVLVDDKDLPNLPAGWCWLKISSLGDIETGNTPPKKNPAFYGGGIPFFKPTDLEAGHNVVAANEYLSKLGFSEARPLPENSILVTCIGATIGKTGIIRRRGTSNQQINSIIPETVFDPDFIYFQVIGPLFQKEIKNNYSSTTLPILNKSKFSELLFAACSSEEQRLIAEHLRQQMSSIDKLDEEIEFELSKSEALRQSILKKAFSGQLVAQDPSDEPASALLERIKAEKADQEKSNKKNKRRNAA